jgi:outer membrane protein TolC
MRRAPRSAWPSPTACRNLPHRQRQTDADQLRAAQTADNDARQSLAIARILFQAGAIDYVSVLNAEQMYQTAQLAVVQAEMMRLTDTAALFQALGGGWWNRNDPTAVQPT